MAKKSAKKGNNFGVILFNFLTLALAGLLLGFVALPHIKAEVSTSILGGASTSKMTSGYGLISFEEGANIGVSVVLLLLVIFASLLALFAILKLLCNFKLVKNASVAKFASWLCVLCALAVAVLAIANIITVATACKADGNALVSGGTYAMWGTLIVNAILGAATLATSALATRK